MEFIRLWSAQQGHTDGPPDEQMGGQEEKAEEEAIQSVDAPQSRGGDKERRGNGYLKPI